MEKQLLDDLWCLTSETEDEYRNCAKPLIGTLFSLYSNVVEPCYSTENLNLKKAQAHR